MDQLVFHPLSNSEIEEFKQQGYLVLRNVLNTQEVEAFRKRADQIIETAYDNNREQLDSLKGYYTGYRNVIARDKEFVPLMTHPRIFSAICQLMGANIQLTVFQLLYKFPQQNPTAWGARYPDWHRDGKGFDFDLGSERVPRVMIKCSVALNDLTQVDCGNLTVVKGSHKRKTRCHFNDLTYDPPGAEAIRVNQGDAVLFENRLWHAGSPNYSNETRRAIMIGYSYRWMRTIDYLKQPDELFASLTPIQRHLVDGFDDIRGHRDGAESPIVAWLQKNDIDYIPF